MQENTKNLTYKKESQCTNSLNRKKILVIESYIGIDNEEILENLIKPLKPKKIIFSDDLARWEAQLRYRAGATNWKINNPDEDILKKYKRGYFLEWRISDKLKDQLHNSIDYLLDTNRKNDPAMVSGRITVTD